MSRPRGNPNMVKGGPAINPGGRPRIADMLDTLGMGKNMKEAFEFARDVMRGTAKDPKNPSMTLDVPIALRLDAAKWLAEKRTGKAPATVDVDVNHGGVVTHTHVNLGAYTEAQLAQMEHLLGVGAQVEALEEGEIVEAEPVT